MVVLRKSTCGIVWVTISNEVLFLNEIPFLLERRPDRPTGILVNIFSKTKEGKMSFQEKQLTKSVANDGM